jgi:hypothetical protein
VDLCAVEEAEAGETEEEEEEWKIIPDTFGSFGITILPMVIPPNIFHELPLPLLPPAKSYNSNDTALNMSILSLISFCL